MLHELKVRVSGVGVRPSVKFFLSLHVMVSKRTSWCIVFVALYPNADVMNFVHQSMWAQKSFFGVQLIFVQNILHICDYNFKGVKDAPPSVIRLC